jgi:restriction system protein
MADVAIPPYHQLLWPTLKAVEALGGSASIAEIEAKVLEMENFSEQEQTVLHGDGPGTEVGYRLAWARTYLKSVGALENSARGVWAITDEGRHLTTSDMAAIPARVRAMQQQGGRRRQRRGQGDEVGPEGEPPDWKMALLEVLQSLPADGFERLAQRLLREAGFISVEVTGRSGDGGIDGVGILRLSLMSFPMYFQCKRWRGSVGPSEVRDFRGAMAGRGEKGVLITTGTFTRDAEREARRDGAPPVDLIDGDQLCERLKEYRLGISVEKVETERVTVRPDWYAEV